jgi:hypothetical protein
MVVRCFTEYWKKGDVAVVDELGVNDLVFYYPMHGELHGREPVKKMLTEFRKHFLTSASMWPGILLPGGTVDGRWEGGGTHTGPLSAICLSVPFSLQAARRFIFHE